MACINRRLTSLCGRAGLLSHTWAAPSTILSRSFAQQGKYERVVEHGNVGTIGHVDHGKTTLSAAITKVLAAEGIGKTKEVKFDKIDVAPQEKKRGITINSATIEYATNNRHYAHTDCPGHRDYVKNMITGSAQLETAILVVAATDGIAPQTKEHVLLANQIGIPNLVVYINKCDEESDEEMLELVEMEVRDLLELHKFDADKVPFVRGSALCALNGTNEVLGKQSILNLCDELDKMPLPRSSEDEAFMMPIDNIYAIQGIGTIVAGRVERGTVKVGDSVEICGIKENKKAAVMGVEMFQKQVDKAIPGDTVGLAVKGVNRKEVKSGMMAVKPGSVKTYSTFEAECYFLTPEEGGRNRAIRPGFGGQLHMKTAAITGHLEFLGDDREVIVPGDSASVKVTLIQPGVVWESLRFALRQAHQTVAAGVVTKCIE